MNTINKNTVNALQELLKKNYDAEAGYKQIMTKAENEPLKGWLQSKALQRSKFATQIDSQLRAINETPAKEGTVLGSAHRLWIDTKTALAKNNDEAILEECIRGEQASVKEYEEQLQTGNFKGEINTLINSQLLKIKSTLDKVKKIEDVIS